MVWSFDHHVLKVTYHSDHSMFRCGSYIVNNLPSYPLHMIWSFDHYVLKVSYHRPRTGQCNVGPDLGPNFLQRLSAKDTIVGKELMNFLWYDHLTTIRSKLPITVITQCLDVGHTSSTICLHTPFTLSHVLTRSLKNWMDAVRTCRTL